MKSFILKMKSFLVNFKFYIKKSHLYEEKICKALKIIESIKRMCGRGMIDNGYLYDDN